jgi:hypothetical protein
VANDATVRIGGVVLDLPRQKGGRSLAGKQVEVRLELDGRLVVADGSRKLLTAETDMDPGRPHDLEKARFSLKGVLPSGHREAPGYPPSKDHPWRRATSGSKLEAIQRAERGLTESRTSRLTDSLINDSPPVAGTENPAELMSGCVETAQRSRPG